MKKLCLISSFLFAALGASAQITLTASSYTAATAGTTDTFKTLTLSTLPVQGTGANQVWDFTGVTYDNTFYQSHSATSGSFSGIAQYTTDNIPDSIGYTYYYQRTDVGGVAPTGLFFYGKHFEAQHELMGAITGTTSDNFYINDQDMVLDTPRTEIAFPATYLSTWQSSTAERINGQLSVSAMSYYYTSFQFRYTYTTRDTVTGWGVLKLKNSAGEIRSIDVLQVKSVMTGTYGTFIDGTPITESQKDYMELPDYYAMGSFTYKYYAANEVTPIVQSYGTLSSPAQAVMLSKNYAPTAVPQVSNTSAISVYPNPVTGHNFMISAPKANVTGYELVNALGQVVYGNTVAPNQSSYSIQVPAGIATGAYTLHITDNTKEIFTQKLIIQ